MTKREARWATALHEAGHLVVAVRANRWRVKASAYVMDDGSGVAVFPHGLTRFDSTTATAAAERAEGLARLYPAPARQRRPAMPKPGFTAERIRAAASIESQQQAARACFTQASGDAESIAAWCIAGHETDPREWARRYRRVQAAARLAVWRYQVEIVTVALKLFHTGVVRMEGNEQDEAALRQRAKNRSQDDERADEATEHR